jgi:hypothetical protein
MHSHFFASFSSNEKPLNFFKFSRLGKNFSKFFAKVRILAAVSIKVSFGKFKILITSLTFKIN